MGMASQRGVGSGPASDTPSSLTHPQAPHRTTHSRALGEVIDVDEFERVVREFVTRTFDTKEWIQEWIQVTIDGKVLRGSIAVGQTRGVHLLAAYVPDEGWVLAQVEVDGEVDGKENEIKAAPRLLRCIDLRGKIVSADAMFAQRELSIQIVSIQIVEAGGQYVWTV